MAGLRLVALGVGDAFSSHYYSSCLALEAESCWLLIDCPHPIRKIMREAGETAGLPLDVDRILAVALTHLHADHSSGLEDLGFYSFFELGRRVELLAHPEVSARLWENSLAGAMEWILPVTPGKEPKRARLEDYFHLVPLSETQAVQVGPFSILCRRTLHTIPTTAFLIRGAGQCFGYSADTAYDPTLLDWLAQADLFVHETNMGIHTPYEKLAALPVSLRRKMRLIHYPDEFNVGTSVIEPLRQGQSYGLD